MKTNNSDISQTMTKTWKPQNSTKFVQDSGFLFLRNVIVQVVNFVKGMVIPGMLGPVNYGMFKILGTYSQYFQYTSLGLSRTVGRNLPIEIELDDKNEQTILINSTLTIIFITSGLFGIGLLIAFGMHWDLGLITDVKYYGFLGLWLIPYSTNLLFGTILLCRTAFVTFGKIEIFTSLLYAITSLSLIWLWGFSGLLVATLLDTYLKVIIYWLAVKPSYHFCLPWGKLWNYWNIGFQMTFNGILITLFSTIPLLVIAKYCGTWWVGQLGIILAIISVIEALPAQAYTVLAQYISRAFGRAPDDFSLLLSMVDRPALILLCIGGIFIALVPTLISILIRTFLPKYLVSLSLLPWVTMTIYFDIVLLFPALMFNLFKRQRVFAAINILTLGAMLLGFQLVQNRTTNAEPFVAVSLITIMLNAILSLGTTFRLLQASWKFILRYMGRILFIPFPILAISIWLSSQIYDSILSMVMILLGSLVLSIITGIFFIILFPEYHLWQLLRSFNVLSWVKERFTTR